MSDELYEGLQALADSTFPKHCNTCGRDYHSAGDFIQQTEDLARGSGLKASWDDDDRPIVELYRNCVCGSTMMDFFTDRRDLSDKGLQRRAHFGNLLIKLEQRGLDSQVARNELIKLLHGQHSEILEKLGLKRKKANT